MKIPVFSCYRPLFRVFFNSRTWKCWHLTYGRGESAIRVIYHCKVTLLSRHALNYCWATVCDNLNKSRRGRGLCRLGYYKAAWKVGDRGYEPRSGLQVSKKKKFLSCSLAKIQYYGEPQWPRGSVLGLRQPGSILNAVYGGQWHLIYLSILRRFSSPSLASCAHRSPKTPFILFSSCIRSCTMQSWGRILERVKILIFEIILVFTIISNIKILSLRLSVGAILEIFKMRLSVTLLLKLRQLPTCHNF